MHVKQSAQEMLLPKKLYFPLKSRGADGCVDLIEWIHCKLEDKRSILNTEGKLDQMIPDGMSNRSH